MVVVAAAAAAKTRARRVLEAIDAASKPPPKSKERLQLAETQRKTGESKGNNLGGNHSRSKKTFGEAFDELGFDRTHHDSTFRAFCEILAAERGFEEPRDLARGT